MSPREATAPYRRIADDVARQISSGELGSGEQLVVADLMERYAVSRNTVLRAFRLLMERGLVRTEQGWGTFVV